MKKYKPVERIKKYQISKISKKLRIIFIAIGSFLLVVYFVFIQIQSINYNNNLNKVQKEISSIINQINLLKEHEALLETDVNTNSNELKDLQSTLATLQIDLKAAVDKLNTLK